MTAPAMPEGLFEFIGRFAPPDPHTVPARIVVAPDVHVRLTRLSTGRVSQWADHLLGMRVDVNPDLEAGVWQVLAADGTLLRDSRSTNEVTL